MKFPSHTGFRPAAQRSLAYHNITMNIPKLFLILKNIVTFLCEFYRFLFNSLVLLYLGGQDDYCSQRN
jgi:hypothetical protein